MSNPEQQLQNRMSKEEPDDGVPIVLVTGASGFIATHIIKQLLEQGFYHACQGNSTQPQERRKGKNGIMKFISALHHTMEN